MSRSREINFGFVIGLLIAGLMFFYGAWLFGNQVYNYLQNGVWVSHSILAELIAQAKPNSWWAAPTSWIGLHNIVSSALEFISYPFALMAFGITLFAGAID